jgi:hypothetical protein
MGNNCKNCKTWDKWNQQCDYPDWKLQSEEVGDSDFFLYAQSDDDSGLTIGMKCGPNFGCVKFQAIS